MKQKLLILYQGGAIDASVYTGMINVIDELERLRGEVLPETQGWMLISHMASALMRSGRGEVINSLDPDIYQELCETGQLTKLRNINHGLLAHFGHSLHKNEEGYLLVNLYGVCREVLDRKTEI